MTIVEQIKKEVITSMKAKDKDKTTVLRNVKNKLDEKAKEQKVEHLTDLDSQKIIQKYVKERKDSITMAKKANREDLVEKEEFEISILEQYLPKLLSLSETKDIITDIINDGNNNIGQIMGKLSKYGNTIDKGLASKIARELL